MVIRACKRIDQSLTGKHYKKPICKTVYDNLIDVDLELKLNDINPLQLTFSNIKPFRNSCCFGHRKSVKQIVNGLQKILMNFFLRAIVVMYFLKSRLQERILYLLLYYQRLMRSTLIYLEMRILHSNYAGVIYVLA